MTRVNDTPKRSRTVSRADVEDAEFRAALIDAIDTDPDVRAAILRLARPRQARPTVTARKTGGR